MRRVSSDCDADVFISYASRNRERAVQIAELLESAGVKIWRDQSDVQGGENYGPKIVQGIRNCKVLLLLCTDASMRSKNVKQEIQLAWHYGRPYLPLLVEPINSYPEQVQYWLEGWQWIEVLDQPAAQWLPRTLQSLANAGVTCDPKALPGSSSDAASGWLSWLGRLTGAKHKQAQSTGPANPLLQPAPATQGLEGLLALARFTDQMWPVPADHVPRGVIRSGLRDLGAPQDDLQHGHRLGSRVCLAIESDRAGHLLLLDEGTSGKIYCLCPSHFVPQTRLEAGRTYLPQPGSPCEAFVVSGKPGREHLLAILANEPLGLDWMPADPKVPARVLSPADIDTLLARLRGLEGNRWTALSTYFDVIG